MYYLGVSFLTVVWAVVAFIDNNIMNILAGQDGQGAGSGVAETAAQIVAHTTLSGALISIATTFLYFQATNLWFNLMVKVGGKSMEQANQAMDEMGSSASKVGDTISKKIDK